MIEYPKEMAFMIESIQTMVEGELQRSDMKDVPINRIIVLKRILQIWREDPEDSEFFGDLEFGKWLITMEIRSEFEKEIANGFE